MSELSSSGSTVTRFDDRRLKVISLVETVLGHAVYVDLMTKFLKPSRRIDILINEYAEGRSIANGIIRRIMTSGRWPGSWGRNQNLDFFRLRAQLANSIIARSRAKALLDARQGSVLHFHTQSIALLSSSLMKAIPTVVSIDFTSTLAAKEFTCPMLAWTHEPNVKLDTQVFRAARRVVAWSHATRDSVIKDHGIREENVVVIPPGVDVDFIKPSYGARKFDPKPRILFIGNDFKRKGGFDCLSVFQDSLNEIASLDILTNCPEVVGGCNVRVHRGVRPYTDEWLTLLRSADVFVLPTYSEAFGQVFCEAMAAGLPVVATKVNAIPEIVVDGISGILVSPGDPAGLATAIKELLLNSDKRRAFGEAGRRIALDKFDASVNFARLEEEFISAAGSRHT